MFSLTGEWNPCKNKQTQITVFIRLNAAAFIKFSAFPMRRLYKGGVYSSAAFVSESLFLNHWQLLL